MTLSEVEGVVGVPPGLYDVQLLEVTGFLPPDAVSSEAWAGPEGTLVVFFDKDGDVLEARFHGEPASVWQRMLSAVR